MNKLIISLLIIISSVTNFANQSIENRGEYYLQAKAYCESMLQQEPYNIDVLSDYGFVLKKLGEVAAARCVYERALSICPDHPRLHRAMAHILLAQGDWQQGWHEYEWRWIPVPDYAYRVKQHIEQYGSLQGIRLLLKTEYGFGDIFQFIRYALVFKNLGAYIIVESHPKLVSMLSKCPYLDEVIAADTALPPYDLQAFIMSGPLICNTMSNTVPASIAYLYAEPRLVDYWRPSIVQDRTLNIGICWQADHTSKDEGVRHDAQEKSLAVEYFAQLAQMPGIRLYSLQKYSDDLHKLDALGIIHFNDLDEKEGSFMDTAAIMQHLDLIITIDTSIAHLAGALGKKTWLLLPYAADWRWLQERDDTPWYPTMKLFRQQQPGDWAGVLRRIQKEIVCL
jgi:tetratricopeptide (TPR) repeat protein